jgi:hypothetical protein
VKSLSILASHFRLGALPQKIRKATQVIPKTLDAANWRNAAFKQLNHAERFLDPRIQQEVGAKLLAIGSTIPMSQHCEAVTVAMGLQHSIAVPNESGNDVTTPSAW